MTTAQRGRGREVEGEREHGARSGKTEIQFERCMLDPLAGPAHFEIGYSFYCESGLLPVYTASEFTAESRTRKGRAGRKRGRVSGKGKGRVQPAWGGIFLSFVPPTLRPSPSSPTSPVYLAFALSPLILLVVAAALLYPSLFLPPPLLLLLLLSAVGRFLVAREIVVVPRLMEVTKVEVVPIFKVAISDSRVSRAHYTLSRRIFRI